MTSNEFDRLCADLEGKIEDRSFDMKRDPPAVRDVVKEIQAGLNGIEPRYRLIIGIDEGPRQRFEKANINPIVWPIASGAFADPDSYRLAIDVSLRSTTSDFHEGLWRFDVIDAPGGDLLVVDAFQSP